MHCRNDGRNNDTSAFSFTFNVCGALSLTQTPQECQGLSPDPSTCAFQSIPAGPSFPGYCQSLGVFSAAAPPSYALLDPYDPSYGFNMTYAVPSSSGSNGCTAPSFHLIFRCGYDDWLPPSSSTSLRVLITETFNCHYEAYSWTKKGCPLGGF